MALIALLLYVVWFTLAFGIRTHLHRRRNGDSGFRGLSGRPGTAPWFAGLLFGIALLTGLLSPVSALAGLNPLPGLNQPALQTTGLIVTVLGVIATVAAQAAMGTTWRVGVDPAERTGLVTSGAFQLARNPVFTAMTLTAAGLAMMVPNVVAIAGLIALIVAIQLQVRIVEEPYLRQIHGADYLEYVAAVGRFLPGIGRS
ncbi:methyltransferase family protein [Kribbella sp. DT2]|uniref:methyltransferase family protein n=1 Tax=Kribbella sp. DT2 TaxID=3393427 RepID=UPI003CF611CB